MSLNSATIRCSNTELLMWWPWNEKNTKFYLLFIASTAVISFVVAIGLLIFFTTKSFEFKWKIFINIYLNHFVIAGDKIYRQSCILCMFRYTIWLYWCILNIDVTDIIIPNLIKLWPLYDLGNYFEEKSILGPVSISIRALEG